MSFSRVTLLVAAAMPLALAAPARLTAQVPTPESVLGFAVGADFELATYEQSLDYFQRLAAASDRVELREVGRTSFGRPWYLALISSAENLRNVERYREIAHRLAEPADDMTDEEARRLASEGRAIVHIDGGLHATEVAHGQHTIQLAYDLVTGDDDPEIARRFWTTSSSFSGSASTPTARPWSRTGTTPTWAPSTRSPPCRGCTRSTSATTTTATAT